MATIREDFVITQNSRPTTFITRRTGIGGTPDLSGLATDDLHQTLVDPDGVTLVDLTIQGSATVDGFFYEPAILTGAAIDGAFQADNNIRSTLVIDEIREGSTAVVAGSGSNDGTYLTEEMTRAGVVPVINTDGTAVVFTAEAGAGTLTISDASRFRRTIMETTTDTLTPCVGGKQTFIARWDGTLPEAFTSGSVTVEESQV